MESRMYSVREGDGKEAPPVNEAQLYAYVRSGHVQPATPIKDLQSGQWFAAGENPSLAVIFRQRGVNPNVPKYTPPPPAPPAAVSSVVDAAVPPIPSNPLLEECTRQYRHANYLVCLGLFFSGGLFGVILIVYGSSQKASIRRQVAASGVDAQVWAAPMDQQVRSVQRILVACIVLGIISALVGAIYITSQPRPPK